MISFDASGKWEGLDGMGDEILREMKPRAEAALVAGSALAVSEIKVTLTGTRSGRTYKASKTGKPHIASAPGEPPAVLFGHLRNSIGASRPKWESWEVSVEVGSGLGKSSKDNEEAVGYARILEYGGFTGRGGATHIAARPYMRPAMERVEPSLTALFEERI